VDRISSLLLVGPYLKQRLKPIEEILHSSKSDLNLDEYGTQFSEIDDG